MKKILVTLLWLIAVNMQAQLKLPFESMEEKIIVVSTILNCNVEEAFTYFTENKKLELWLTKKAKVEPQIGAPYELFWEPEDPENNSTLGCKVLAVNAPHYINFEWKGPRQYEHFMNDADPLTNVTVLFTPMDEKTQVTLLHVGWRANKEWQDAWEYFDQGWRPPFEKLEKLINK